MSSRENFKQAAKELFGLDTSKSDRPSPLEGFISDIDTETPPPQAPQAAPPEDAPAAQPAEVYVPQSEPAVAYQPEATAYQPEPEAYPNTPPMPPAAQPEPAVPTAQAENLGDYALIDSRRETSIIAKGTTIVGRIRTDGHIEVMGKVEGNVDAEGNVAVSGRVTGNVRGQHLELLSAQIKGDLTASAGVFVSNDSVIIGDVSAENIIFDGRIKGNIVASQAAEFNRNSYLLGDITAKSVAIEPGAVINGMIRTTADPYSEGEFDEFNIF